MTVHEIEKFYEHIARIPMYEDVEIFGLYWDDNIGMSRMQISWENIYVEIELLHTSSMNVTQRLLWYYVVD